MYWFVFHSLPLPSAIHLSSFVQFHRHLRNPMWIQHCMENILRDYREWWHKQRLQWNYTASWWLPNMVLWNWLGRDDTAMHWRKGIYLIGDKEFLKRNAKCSYGDPDMSDFIACLPSIYLFCNHVSQFVQRIGPNCKIQLLLLWLIMEKGVFKRMALVFQYLAVFAIYLRGTGKHV